MGRVRGHRGLERLLGVSALLSTALRLLIDMAKTNREHQAAWYTRNKAKKVALVEARRQRNRAYVWQIKIESECIRCGEDHPAVLDFHHPDPSAKENTIRQAADLGRSLERLAAEAAQCDVLCSNCHRKHHYEERQSAPL